MIQVLRRADKNATGRIENADLDASYDDYFRGLITKRELDAVYDAWFASTKFLPRLIKTHPRDYAPSLPAIAGKRLPSTLKKPTF